MWNGSALFCSGPRYDADFFCMGARLQISFTLPESFYTGRYCPNLKEIDFRLHGLVARGFVPAHCADRLLQLCSICEQVCVDCTQPFSAQQMDGYRVFILPKEGLVDIFCNMRNINCIEL